MSAGGETFVGEFFRLREFADKRGGGLPPAASHIPLARLCCVLLDPLRRRFGPVTIDSGYRTDASNTAVGGATQSRHMYHRFPNEPAADIRCATGNVGQWTDFLAAILAGKGALGRYRTHVHVDRRATPSRWTA
jgi:zinc D-Ala-D-Ala carboxypeptidase